MTDVAEPVSTGPVEPVSIPAQPKPKICWRVAVVAYESERMTSFVSHTTIDCDNAYDLSEWWKQVLGYVDIDGDPNLPGHEECMIRDPTSGHQVLFIEVAESK